MPTRQQLVQLLVTIFVLSGPAIWAYLATQCTRDDVWHQQAVEAGHAHYDPTTGLFTWNDPGCAAPRAGGAR